MLRARYLRSLEEKHEGSWWALRLGKKVTKRKPFSLRETISAENASVRGDSNVELTELGTSDWEFVGVVASLTEIGEDGVFRHVVQFL